MPSVDSAVTGQERVNARRAVLAATIGTAIEWYDFYVYGLIAGLVLGKLFFPEQDGYAGTLLSLSTFFVGFVARPIGAVIFGHLGDRLGRRATLVVTLLLMGGGTVLVGFVPTYASIGVWGAVILTVLRIVQGIGTGGEWSGSVLMAVEWKSARGRRGLTASWPQFGSPLGLLVATAVLLVLETVVDTPTLLAWAWRVPFWASALLIVVGLIIRFRVTETTEFARLRRTGALSRTPVLAALRGNWREIILTCLMRAGQHAPFYVFTTFVVAYGQSSLHLSETFLLAAVLVASAVSLVTTPFWGAVSDRFGRRRVYLIGIVVMFCFALPYTGLLATSNAVLVLVAVVASLVVHDMQYGPQGAYIAESFPSAVRYSGSSLGYQLSSITAGGPAPLIATFLVARFGSAVPVALYIMAMAVIGFIATLLLKAPATRLELDDSPDEPARV